MCLGKGYCDLLQWLLTGKPRTQPAHCTASTEEGFQQFNFFCCASHPLFLSPPLPLFLPLSLISPFPIFLVLYSNFFFSLKSVESRIYSHTLRFASLSTAKEELIHASSTENTEDLKDLNNSAFCFELLKIEH